MSAAAPFPPPPTALPPFSSTSRSRHWPTCPRSLPLRLQSAEHMHTSVISNTSLASTVYTLHVGQASVQSDQLSAFASFLLSYLLPLLEGMPPMGRYEANIKAYWCLELSPNGQHFACLSSTLASSTFYSVMWGTSHVLVPVSVASPPLPPNHRTLKFLQVPFECSRLGLPEAVLNLAGYSVTTPSPLSPPSQPPPGSNTVVLLSYRLGANANAAVFIVKVLPPLDDPYLRCLPPFIPQLSKPGHTPFSTLVDNDPLPWTHFSSLRHASAAPAVPSSTVPSPDVTLPVTPSPGPTSVPTLQEPAELDDCLDLPENPFHTRSPLSTTSPVPDLLHSLRMASSVTRPRIDSTASNSAWWPRISQLNTTPWSTHMTPLAPRQQQPQRNAPQMQQRKATDGSTADVSSLTPQVPPRESLVQSPCGTGLRVPVPSGGGLDGTQEPDLVRSPLETHVPPSTSQQMQQRKASDSSTAAASYLSPQVPPRESLVKLPCGTGLRVPVPSGGGLGGTLEPYLVRSPLETHVPPSTSQQMQQRKASDSSTTPASSLSPQVPLRESLVKFPCGTGPRVPVPSGGGLGGTHEPDLVHSPRETHVPPSTSGQMLQRRAPDSLTTAVASLSPQVPPRESRAKSPCGTGRRVPVPAVDGGTQEPGLKSSTWHLPAPSMDTRQQAALPRTSARVSPGYAARGLRTNPSCRSYSYVTSVPRKTEKKSALNPDTRKQYALSASHRVSSSRTSPSARQPTLGKHGQDDLDSPKGFRRPTPKQQFCPLHSPLPPHNDLDLADDPVSAPSPPVPVDSCFPQSPVPSSSVLPPPTQCTERHKRPVLGPGRQNQKRNKRSSQVAAPSQYRSNSESDRASDSDNDSEPDYVPDSSPGSTSDYDADSSVHEGDADDPPDSPPPCPIQFSRPSKLATSLSPAPAPCDDIAATTQRVRYGLLPDNLQELSEDDAEDEQRNKPSPPIRIPAYSTPSKPASASFLQPDRPQRARQPPQPWFKVNPLFKTETPSRATSSLDPAVYTSKREGGAGGALG